MKTGRSVFPEIANTNKNGEKIISHPKHNITHINVKTWLLLGIKCHPLNAKNVPRISRCQTCWCCSVLHFFYISYIKNSPDKDRGVILQVRFREVERVNNFVETFKFVMNMKYETH